MELSEKENININSTQKTYSILVADDDKFSLMLTMSNLESSGRFHEIFHAPNGKVACKIAERKQPDIILMDWEMPEMSGLDAVKYLKSNDQTKRIPIIMATSHASPEYLEKAFNAGAMDYVRKPVDRIELLVRLSAAIELTTSYKEIMQQKDTIEKQKNQILESIQYAKIIQSAILPSDRKMQTTLHEHFVILRPRDIVSGDFYWLATYPPDTEKFDKIIIAAADCTGHGVPGALMAMVGNSLLNQIVLTQGMLQPDLILNELHKELRQMFTQGNTASDDGMAIGICVIDNQAHRLYFSGAETPLVFFQNNKFYRLEGDERGVGGSIYGKERCFASHTINLQTTTEFYMFSDGFQDQFGGETGEKFLTMRFMKLLQKIHSQPFNEQEKILLETIEKWMGANNKQIDDIMVLGMRIG